MLGIDKGLLDSNFCNISLVERRDFPKVIELIQKSYFHNKTSSDVIHLRNKPSICTSATKTACRITSQLKKDLKDVASNNPFENEFLKEKLVNRSMNMNEDDYEENHSYSVDKFHRGGPLPRTIENKKPGMGARNGIETSLGDHTSPYDYNATLPNTRIAPDIHVAKLREILEQDQRNKYRNEYSPDGKKEDHFLQRIQEYRVLYQAFMTNFASQTRKKSNKSFEDANDASAESLVNNGKKTKMKLNHSHTPNSPQATKKLNYYGHTPTSPQTNKYLNRSLDQKSSPNNSTSSRIMNKKLPDTPIIDDMPQGKPPVLLNQKLKRPENVSKSDQKAKVVDGGKIVPKPPAKKDERIASPRFKRNVVKHESTKVTPDVSNRTETKARAKSELRPRPAKKSLDIRRKDEDMTEVHSQNVANLLAKCANVENNYDFDIVMENLIQELRKHHTILSKLSYKAVNEIMRTCSIINIKNQELYREKENNEFCYIILSGEVYLKSKVFGVFKRCLVGESVGEEAIIENHFLKHETAQIITQTALLEINHSFLERLRDSLSVGYRSDYTILLGILRKNLNQKKLIRQKIISG